MIRKKAPYFIALFFIICALGVILRLGWLQIVKYDELVALADNQQVKTVEITSSVRGSVLDRNGDYITGNQEEPAVLVFPTLVENPAATAKSLSTLFSLSETSLLQKIVGRNDAGEEVRYQPFYVKTNLTEEEEKAVAEADLQGVFIVGYQSRYLRDRPLLHVLGSLGTVTEDDILTGKVDDDYQAGDIIGISGLERIYEKELRGSGGKKIGVVVDEKNNAIDADSYYVYDLGSEENKTKLALTIDLGIQRCLEDALNGLSGAAVVLDSQSGDVLGIASAPKYDPEYLESPESEDAYVNKALSAYPPASLFKIFVTAIALEDGIINENTPVFCDGSYTLSNGRVIHCWQEEGHGLMTFSEALAQSCNPVFVDLVLKVGSKRLAEAFAEWELSEDILLGYPLSQMSSLETASTDSKLANEVLGEEGVFMTPLNIAKEINVIASGGLITTPRLVTSVYNESEEKLKEYPSAIANRVISEETAERVKNMMLKTFTMGTAESLDLAGLNIAGKTGSSETGNVWIGGFFPADKPKYTIVILVENGSSGVGDAGPPLKKIVGYLENN